MASATPGGFGIYYEHPDWFRPLFAELDRRGVPSSAARRRHSSTRPTPTAAVRGRLQPDESVGLPPRARPLTFYTLQYLAHLERLGVRVDQRHVGLAYGDLEGAAAVAARRARPAVPRARVIHHAAQAPAAADGLRFPLVVKPNIGGSGAGIVRFDTRRRSSGRRAKASTSASTAPRWCRNTSRAAGRPHRPRRGARRPVPLRASASTPPATASTSARRTSARPWTARSWRGRPARWTRRRTTCASRATRRRREIIAAVEAIVRRPASRWAASNT